MPQHEHDRPAVRTRKRSVDASAGHYSSGDDPPRRVLRSGLLYREIEIKHIELREPLTSVDGTLQGPKLRAAHVLTDIRSDGTGSIKVGYVLWLTGFCKHFDACANMRYRSIT